MMDHCYSLLNTFICNVFTLHKHANVLLLFPVDSSRDFIKVVSRRKHQINYNFQNILLNCVDLYYLVKLMSDCMQNININKSMGIKYFSQA